jgi:predicted nucleotide-binding protein
MPGVAYAGGDPTPSFCENCGEPFPWKVKADAQEETTMPTSPASNKVFIIHGHADDMKEAVARTVGDLGLNPIILHEQPNQGRTIIEKFEDYANVGFAVALLSGDDIAYPIGTSPKKARPRARQNVILELGFFYAKLGRGKVVALYKKADNFEIPSDFQGILYTEYDAAGHWRYELVRELQAAEYNVDANRLTKKP